MNGANMQAGISLPHPAAATRPWYRHPWPWLLMAGPMAVVIGGSFTGWLAFKGQDALVVDDYYKQGKAINQDLRRDRAAARLQLASILRYDAVAGRLEGNISSMGKPYTGTMFVTLVHSTQPGKDVRLALRPDASGRFSVSLPMLDIARWQVLLEGEQRDWRLTSVWQWPQEQGVRMLPDAPPAD